MSKNNIGNSKSTISTSIISDKVLQFIVNIGTVVLFAIIVYLVYVYFIKKDYKRYTLEGFDDAPITQTMGPGETVYEKAVDKMFGTNLRMMCSILPNIDRKECMIEGKAFVAYNFPVHMIKMPDGTILAVFNDGRLYEKSGLTSTMWQGPLERSMPRSVVPLRMIAIGKDLTTLYGVGYDNVLYMKPPTKVNNKSQLNLKADWVPVANNSNIIYVLFDRDTGFMISIGARGNILIKTDNDITKPSRELATKLDRPVLKLFYDLNGYMLALDTNFDLYQFNDINWKDSTLNVSRGANSSKLLDVLYNNDGKMYGLVLNPEENNVKVMKQSEVFYLSDFIPLDIKLTPDTNDKFVMNDMDIIQSKTGNITDYKNKIADEDKYDEDPNYAYQKQMLDNKDKLRKFCAERKTQFGKYDNYDIGDNVNENSDKIKQLETVIESLLKYEPEKDKIIQKYPILIQRTPVN